MTQIAELRERLSAIAADLENPDFDGDLDARITEGNETRAAYDAAVAREAQRVAAADQARAALAVAPATQTRATGTPAPRGEQPEQRSLGARVLEHPQFMQFRDRQYSGQIAIDMPGTTRALLDNTSGSLGAFQNPTRPTDVPMANADRVLRLADLIDRRPTDSNTVEYVQETTAAGAGGTGAEAAEGTLKAEATFTFQVVTDSVRTIAHWVNITRQAASDNAQMVGYIEGRLGYGLEHRLDAQILNGNGTSPNLRGILNTPGTSSYVAPAGEANVISIRRAITLGQQSEYAPDTVVMNPADWERIELSTDTNGMFRVSPNVANALAPRIWGLNVVPTTAIVGGSPDPDGAGALVAVAGRFVVGSFRMGATLWERDGIRVLMTDSHASNFTSNILTLLAEMRAALSIWRPKAFVVGTFATP